MTATQLDIDGREERAPVLPQAFLTEWRRLEEHHRIPRTTPTCLHSSVRLDVKGADMFAAFVTFKVAVGGVAYSFFRSHTQVAEAAREMWRKTGRPS